MARRNDNMKTLYTRLGFVEGDVLLSMNGIHQHLETVLGTSWNLSQPSNKQVQDSPSTSAKDIGNFTAALLHYAGIPIVPKKELTYIVDERHATKPVDVNMIPFPKGFPCIST